MKNELTVLEFQRQIQYKAACEGIPVSFIYPKRTSCSVQYEDGYKKTDHTVVNHGVLIV